MKALKTKMRLGFQNLNSDMSDVSLKMLPIVKQKICQNRSKLFFIDYRIKQR